MCYLFSSLILWFDQSALLCDPKVEVSFALQVRPVAEDEMFKVLRSGKRKSKRSAKFSCCF